MQHSHPYDLVIGLDRSDRTADLHLINTRDGSCRSQCISTSPEALWQWLLELRQQHATCSTPSKPLLNMIVKSRAH